MTSENMASDPKHLLHNHNFSQEKSSLDSVEIFKRQYLCLKLLQSHSNYPVREERAWRFAMRLHKYPKFLIFVAFSEMADDSNDLNTYDIQTRCDDILAGAWPLSPAKRQVYEAYYEDLIRDIKSEIGEEAMALTGGQSWVPNNATEHSISTRATPGVSNSIGT